MFLGVYIIVQNINIPLIVQPQLFGALASLSWVQVGTGSVLRFLLAVELTVAPGIEPTVSVLWEEVLSPGLYNHLRIVPRDIWRISRGVNLCC